LRYHNLVTDEELYAKVKEFNALLKEYGERMALYVRLNSEMGENTLLERADVLLIEIQEETARRRKEKDEAQKPDAAK
jgi:hypothetical protein